MPPREFQEEIDEFTIQFRHRVLANPPAVPVDAPAGRRAAGEAGPITLPRPQLPRGAPAGGDRAERTPVINAPVGARSEQIEREMQVDESEIDGERRKFRA